MGGRGQWLDSGIHTETIQMGVLESSLANGMDATPDLFIPPGVRTVWVSGVAPDWPTKSSEFCFCLAPLL